jgi:hypothetical protein
MRMHKEELRREQAENKEVRSLLGEMTNAAAERLRDRETS